MAVILTVSRALSINIFQLNLRYSTASRMAPAPPSADDSVGVAMPAKMEPSTTTIRASGGMMAYRASR